LNGRKRCRIKCGSGLPRFGIAIFSLSVKGLQKLRVLCFVHYDGTQARRAREAKQVAEAKAAGIISGRPGDKAKGSKGERRWKKGVDDGVTPDNIRGPVMHVNEARG
jgi:hypothetical protein